jgi:hypothetical protein
MKRITGTLRDDQCTFLIIRRSFLLRMKNALDENCGEKPKEAFCVKLVFRKCAVFCDILEIYCRAGQATADNMAHARCMLCTYRLDTHTLRICSAYNFPTATMITGTRLNVM